VECVCWGSSMFEAVKPACGTVAISVLLVPSALTEREQLKVKQDSKVKK